MRFRLSHIFVAFTLFTLGWFVRDIVNTVTHVSEEDNGELVYYQQPDGSRTIEVKYYFLAEFRKGNRPGVVIYRMASDSIFSKLGCDFLDGKNIIKTEEDNK